jgi:crotonobetainyl-CoA:carnitine CoA-transferase CaiB-like acyl-CoA transferase
VPGLLDGVRVLDLGIWRPVPYATQLMVEMGAAVVKVEPPGGDPMRAFPALFATLNRGKHSVVLDLKAPADRARLLDLAVGADVVVEGFRPGVADRLGAGYADLAAVNPSVVYCSMSGFGADGPLVAVAGHDVNYQAWSGSLAPDGGEPVAGRVPIADLGGSLAAAMSICAALVRRERTGEGERIDLGITDLLVTWTAAGEATLADGSRTGGMPGYGTFATADGGWVALGVIAEDHFWSALCEVLGVDDAAGLGFFERAPRVADLNRTLAARIATWERDALVTALLAAGVPVAPVLDRAGAVAQPHFERRGSVVAGGRAGHPARYERHPARIGTRVPEPGEHQDVTWAALPASE